MYLVMHRETQLSVSDYFDDGADESRWTGIEGLYAMGCHLYDLAGTPTRPHLYKTLANASRVARDRWAFMSPDKERKTNERSTSKILLFDPTRLLEVTEDVLAETRCPDRENDIVIAERQIQLWSERLRELVDRQKQRAGAA